MKIIKGNTEWIFNSYKGTLIKIMRASETTQSEKSEASRLYMLKLLTKQQVNWLKKFENKFNK